METPRPSDRASIRDELAATIHGNFNACRGRNGVSPTVLAQVVLDSPAIRRIQAETLRKFRADLIGDQFVRYGIVIPDVSEVIDDLDETADRIEKGDDK